jgi:soluble lytic murein transglycosylase-like protein
MRKMRNTKTNVDTRFVALPILRAALIIATVLAAIAASAYDRDTVDAAINQAARRHGVDARLMHAMAMVESSKRPDAKGALGEVGLFQLRPEFHRGASVNPLVNADAAARYLKELELRCRPKYGKAWFICYNTGANRKKTLAKPTEFVYYKKVVAAQGRIAPSALARRLYLQASQLPTGSAD